MSHPSTPRRRWRRTALATAGISLVAALAPGGQRYTETFTVA